MIVESSNKGGIHPLVGVVEVEYTHLPLLHQLHPQRVLLCQHILHLHLEFHLVLHLPLMSLHLLNQEQQYQQQCQHHHQQQQQQQKDSLDILQLFLRHLPRPHRNAEMTMKKASLLDMDLKIQEVISPV